MNAKPKTNKEAAANKPQVKVQDIAPKKDAKGGAAKRSSIVPCI